MRSPVTTTYNQEFQKAMKANKLYEKLLATYSKLQGKKPIRYSILITLFLQKPTIMVADTCY